MERLFYHGTRTEEVAKKIYAEGFKAGTHYARCLADSIEYGGPHTITKLVLK